MASTLPKRAPAVHLNTVEPRMAKAVAKVSLTAEERRRIDDARRLGLDLIELTIESTSGSSKAIALSCGQSESEVSRALDGHARFDFAWLFCQPPEFKEVLWHLVAREWHVRTNRRRREAVNHVVNAIQQLVLILDD